MLDSCPAEIQQASILCWKAPVWKVQVPHRKKKSHSKGTKAPWLWDIAMACSLVWIIYMTGQREALFPECV
jgi:hypothetical protein